MNILTSYHPALLSMHALHDQFPGALNLYLFCNDKGIRSYHSKGKNKGIFFPTDMNNTTNNLFIQKFRKLKTEISWGDKEDLPLLYENRSKRKNEIKQLSIQDEIEQNVLIFRVSSVTDDAFDVFAIQFSKSFSNFYISSGRNVLSSELKLSIGKTIRNQIIWLYSLHKEQDKRVSSIQSAYQQQSDELENVKSDLKRKDKTNQALLEKHLIHLIHEHEVSLNCKIELKAGFLDKIIQSETPIDSIKGIIEEAVLTAYDLAIEKSIVYLTPNLIDFATDKKQAIPITSQLVELNKTHALLDRYEKAARQLEQKSTRINGKSLALELQISAPAITDAIKKHGKKIKRLLEKYPSKWPLLCDFIRPIRDLKWSLREGVG